MLTQFFKSINWVDVGLVLFFIRTVFVSVQSGFVSEGFKFFGTLFSLFLSLHFYSPIAVWLGKIFKIVPANLEFVTFVVLWLLVTIAFMLMYKGVLLLFKIEANHQVVDKYAAGFMGATRGIFLTSLTVFALLLLHNPYILHQTFQSNGYRFTAKAAPNTYAFTFKGVISKIFEGQQFNEDVFAVISRHGVNPK